MDKTILTCTFLFLVNVTAIHKTIAQVNITGTVFGSDRIPIPYASVIFLNSKDSVFAGGTLTGREGGFSIAIKSGSYILQASCLGYKTIEKGINIPGGIRDFVLDTLDMEESVNKLEAVIVRGQKPAYEKKADRININVQSGITTAGSTVLDILAKSPGVFVNRQNGSIEIGGKKGVLFMINGKQSMAPAESAIQMLEGMNSSNIERIEIITAPSAKYEASGSAGIINIILRSNPDSAVNGTINLTSGYQRGPVWGAGAVIRQKSNKLNTFLNYSFRSVSTIHYWKFNSTVKSGQHVISDVNESKRKPITRLNDLRAGLEYQVTGSTQATLYFSGYQRNWDLKAFTRNFYNAGILPFQVSEMEVKEINKWNSYTANLELDQKLARNHSLVMSFDYLYYFNNNPSSYYSPPSGNDQPGGPQLLSLVKKHTPIYYKVGSLDYSYRPGSGLVIESGMKGAFSEFRNKVSVTKFNREDQQGTGMSSDDNLDERIYALYTSVKWQIAPDMLFRTGIRYEYTQSVFNRNTAGGIKKKYGNFFPDLAAIYDITDKRKLQFSYNRRITRPTFNDMAPFVFYVGPRTYVSGNLNLKPAVTGAFELSYNIDKFWASVIYSNTRNDIAQFQPERDTLSGEFILRAQNVDHMRVIGLHAAFPVKISNWWALQNDFTISYTALKTGKGEFEKKNSLIAIEFNIMNVFSLPGDFKAEASATYRSGSCMGISQFGSLASVNMGIKKEFRNTAVISLTVNDMFNTTRWRISTKTDHGEFRSDWTYDWGGRLIALSFSLPFGNRSLKDMEIKPRSASERSRVQ